MTQAARTIAALVLCAMLAACASGPRATAPTTIAEPDEAELAAMQADGTGGATAVAAPAAKWLGRVILQMIQSTQLNVDVKVDAPLKALP